MKIQEEAFTKNHQAPENLSGEWEDESSLGPHAEEDDFENTSFEKDESMESEVETNLSFLKDITLDESSFKNLEEGDPISPLQDDIEDYFHIEKGKWEIISPRFDCDPIYDTDNEDEVEISIPFHSRITCNEISINTLRTEDYYLHEKWQLKVIDSPFREDLIFGIIMMKLIRLPPIFLMIPYSNHLSL